LGKEGRLDREVKARGAEIIYAPVSISNKIAFLSHLRTTLKHGKFDIIHSHHDYLSGFYLLGTLGIKFKKRILHVHNTDKALPIGNKLLHDVLLRPFRFFAACLSDTIVGISQDTLTQFIGRSRYAERKSELLYYGVDFSSFAKTTDRKIFREQNGLPADSIIILFVGRFTPLKNPVFVVDILSELLNVSSRYYAVFVGTGSLEGKIVDQATKLGILGHIRVLGWSDEIALIMKSSDVFVFPRVEAPKEGLGLVVIEAQAAGLPMFITEGIVEDAIVIKPLAHYHSLSESAYRWAHDINITLQSPAAVSRMNCLAMMKSSRFDLTIATRNFIQLYE
jgi:glycosyltransferase involved in cell wall biosynthesis